METRPGAGAARRARNAFWALAATAVLAAGALSASLLLPLLQPPVCEWRPAGWF